MTKNNGFKVAALAASIALAMAATSAMAADPAANALPGQGKVVAGAITAADVTIATGTSDMTIANGAAANVINWGADATATGLNGSGAAGFNIGSGASVDFTGTGAVLNIDSTGNASQIFGALSSAGNVYVANSNGIVVGDGAQISGSGEVGLIANTLGATTGFAGTAASLVYDGTGGNVTVAKGAGIDGASVLIAGGGTVNVDLGNITHAGTVALIAGLPSGVSFAWHTPDDTDNFVAPFGASINSGAALNLTGTLPAGSSFGTTAGGLYSGGAITIGGTVDVGDAAYGATAGGTLTNNGILTWGHAGSSTVGDVVNNGTITLTGTPEIGGSLSNNGEINGPANVILTHGLDNAGNIDVDIIQSKGDFTNSGKITVGPLGGSYLASIDVIGGNFSNSGQVTSPNGVQVTGGNFSNTGTMALPGGVLVINGNITNSGQLTVVDALETRSDTAAGNGFTAGGQYYIDNTGMITNTGSDFQIFADTVRAGTANDSTGSFTNTGTLQIGNPSNLTIQAWNNLSLGGTLQVDDGTGAFKTVSNTHPLVGTIDLEAGGYDGSAFATAGVLTLSTPIVFDGTFSNLSTAGAQVRLMSSVMGVDPTDGSQSGNVYVVAGPAVKDGYAVRIASGQTLSATNVQVDGDWGNDDNPNVILQGTVSGNWIRFGSNQAISDLFSGPDGGLVWTGLFPEIDIAFTGAVKTAPYLNDASNFRYNDLPISNTDKMDALWLQLNPVAYTTNGTSNGLSAVNILVNGDVTLSTPLVASVTANGTAVTGVTNIPNTHLVLQSSGNISTAGNFYWPGYVYLGNVAADADGNAQPGTLGLGTITTGGEFNNVLPGDVAGASGIHLITQFPLTLGGKVVTNANAWVNFGTALLTQKYSGEQTTSGPFFGGAQGPGSVINYGVLDASDFVTQAPDPNK